MTTPMELPTDVLAVSILLRLPPSSRRLSRLVCGQWRDAVDTRTTEMQSRAKPLIVPSGGSAYLVDDLSSAGSHRVLRTNKGTSVVGTCNGLICLCNDEQVGGAITLVNPVTKEKMSVPPPPLRCTTSSVLPHETYGFAYHPTTGRYKIVHVPCFYGRRRNFHVVRVFTLGERWWRDVATDLSARCEYRAGIVGVNGTMYWVAEGTKKVMAFDLDDERLTFVEPPPPPPPDAPSQEDWHLALAEVHGRLGIVFSHEFKLEVWVLEGSTTTTTTTGERKWSRRYTVQREQGQRWCLTRPHFAHSQYLLTERLLHDDCGRGSTSIVYKHKPSDHVDHVGMVEMKEESRGTTIVLEMKSDHFYYYSSKTNVFAYVETTEPLSVYKCWS